MGSGCSSNTTCSDLFQKTTPDTQVEYTGPPVVALGICTHDRLSEVEAVLLQKIIDYSTGVGISIPDIDLTTCDAFATDLRCCQTCTDLPCLLNVYKTAICSLFDEVTTLTTDIGTLLSGPYDTACLTLGANSTLNQIIQELIKEYCALVDRVTAIETALTNSNLPVTIGNFLLQAITTCSGAQSVIKTGTGASASIEFKGFVPIGAIIPYGGITNGKFDSSGLGLAGTDVCGFALANGQNGTTDMRELTPVGAGSGVMGGSGTLPSVASGANYALNQLFGEAKHQLSGGELPAVNVPVSFGNTSHSHQTIADYGGTSQGADGPADYVTTGNQGGHEVSGGLYTRTSSESMSISGSISFGGNVAHENRQPSRALLFIQRIS